MYKCSIEVRFWKKAHYRWNGKRIWKSENSSFYEKLIIVTLKLKNTRLKKKDLLDTPIYKTIVPNMSIVHYLYARHWHSYWDIFFKGWGGIFPPYLTWKSSNIYHFGLSGSVDTILVKRITQRVIKGTKVIAVIKRM